jgi:hypothetical protein
MVRGFYLPAERSALTTDELPLLCPMKRLVLSSLGALVITGVAAASTGPARPAERFRVGIVG